MNRKTRLKLLSHLKLKEGKTFWVTRITNIEQRLDEKAIFKAVYFNLFDIIVIFSTAHGYGQATMIEIAFRKSSYNREQILQWFNRFELRHYDLNESQNNNVPKLADLTHINEDEVLAVGYKRWADNEIKTLDEYLIEDTFYLPKNLTVSNHEMTQDDIYNVMDTLDLAVGD